MCKYPDKTKRGILKLTSKTNVPPPAPYSGCRERPPSRPLDGGWRRNFREGDGDDDDENIAQPSLMLNRPPSRLTGSSNAGRDPAYGAHKRPGTDGGSANNKKAKVVHAPVLGEWKDVNTCAIPHGQ